jgi:hypothetical protein
LHVRVKALLLLVVVALPIAAVTSLAASGRSRATAIPLKAPTGYRDYCDGYAAQLRRTLCPAGGVPVGLWRPLHLPVVTSGACPVSPVATPTTRVAPVLGVGPVFFSAGAYDPRDRAAMLAPDPGSGVAAGTGWRVAKAPLLMRATFQRPIVVRGHRLDADGELGFSGDKGHRPYAAMQFASRARAIPVGAYKALSVVVWVSTPGCYAIQIDSTSFSQAVVFRVAFA